MRSKRVKMLRLLAMRYYLNRIDKRVVSFKRFFRRVKENYNRHGIQAIEALKQAVVR